MEFFETVKKRTSVRAYLTKPIKKGKLGKILEACSLAPSAGNLQAYRVVLVRGRKDKQAIADAAYGQDFIVDAPVLVAFIGDRKRSAGKYGKRGEEFYSVQDATIAAAYCQLAAAALGLGSVWIGGFDEEKVAKILKCKPHEFPAAVIPVGHPAEHMEGHGRREREEMVGEL